MFAISFLSWDRLILLQNSLLALLSVHPIGLELWCFHCHFLLGIFFISFFISSVTSCLFRSVLFNLHVFLFVCLFPPCSWYLILQHCGQRRCLRLFHFFKIYQCLICDPRCELSWRMLHVHTHTHTYTQNLPFLDEMPHRST